MDSINSPKKSPSKNQNKYLNDMILETKNSKYKLIEKIGSGATSKIYKGYDELDKEKKLYAFKIIKQEKLGIASINIIKNEISSLQKLSHPNIIKIYENDFGNFQKKNKEAKQVFFIKIEYLPKGSLFDYIYEIKKPFSENQAKIIIKSLIESLEYIHKNNLCHRDLKPENIMFDENYNLKIVDFGFAEKLNLYPNGKLITILGTPSYSSPELLLQQPYYGISNDIFAIGVILFILVTGNMPFKVAVNEDINYNLIINNQMEKFWEFKNINLSNEFKELFSGLVNFDYSLRPSLSEIKFFKWINNITLNDINEFKKTLKERFELFSQKKNKNIFINNGSNCINCKKMKNPFDYKENVKVIIGNKTLRNKKKDFMVKNNVNKKQKLKEENTVSNNKIKLIFNNNSNGSNFESILSQLLN